MKNNILLTITFIFILCSCSETSPIDLIVDNSSKQTEIVSYELDVKPIINTNCIACHGTIPIAGSPMSLTNLEQVKAAILTRNLLNRINLNNNDSRAMPQGGPKMQQTQIDIITKWQTQNFAQ